MGGGMTAEPLQMNPRAARIADAMAEDARVLRVLVSEVAGARLLDCGIATPAGLEAGRRLAMACMGGLGEVELTTLDFDGMRLPAVTVRTDHPAVACMASQYAGWALRVGDFFAMGSGPLRAIARVERELFDGLEYAEPSSGPGVLVLEGRTPPDAEVVAHVCERAGLAPDRLTVLVAPTASLTGSVQVCARVVETALHKLMELGFDVRRVVGAVGTAPLPPVARTDLQAIGRTNDCILYGGTVHLTVRADDAELDELVPRLPASASADHGEPFQEIFERYGGDFYKVDPFLFSPAEVYVTSLSSGRTRHAGERNTTVLRRSLLGGLE